ncbi:NYN domain-containing protein [Roseomonas xinghualingensis]|uniref:NYN domain-containing protein n=1 Tax=Roseomonas xinghualingensis TaxID=2986475 RepID=UPI0021F1C243|nr:NYN domain-containing protein [Roseomonas sp. SXEYE001]MCV4208946.1 NYN domain-containing protein [Roseomonas sp. SXEYE001]
MERRTALFVDFDNIFSALYGCDPEAAEAFVLQPQRWLDWVGRRASQMAGPDASCRLLVRRCYLNPNGSIQLRSGERVFFGSFRSNLVRVGLQVLDCPPLTRGGKTSADIVMVMDMLDALQHATHFDEFAILSSDADFTPVLQRLRAYDRRTLVVSIGNAASAYRAAADEVIGPEEFIRDALGLGIHEAERRDVPSDLNGTAPGQQVPSLFLANQGDEPDPALDPAVIREAILAHVANELAEAPAPLHLPGLGKRLHERLGAQVRATGFGGAGSLARLLAAAGDPRIELIPGSGGGWVRDPTRHPPYATYGAGDGHAS